MIWVNYLQILIAYLKVIIDQKPAQTVDHIAHVLLGLLNVVTSKISYQDTKRWHINKSHIVT